MKTLITLILDRSGSMGGRVADVVGGVNKFLEEQRAQLGEASVAMVRFDDRYERFRHMMPVKTVPDLRTEEFVPRGSTALLDAIGNTLTAMEQDWLKEQPERAIVVIVTDGGENASTEFNRAKVNEMIKSREASGQWAFIYLGANVDAFAEANSLGINLKNAAGYTATAAGTAAGYAAFSTTVSSMRATGQTVANNLGVANLGEEEPPKPTVTGAAST